MRDYLYEFPIDIYGREQYEKVLNEKIKSGFQISYLSMAHY